MQVTRQIEFLTIEAVGDLFAREFSPANQSLLKKRVRKVIIELN